MRAALPLLAILLLLPGCLAPGASPDTPQDVEETAGPAPEATEAAPRTGSLVVTALFQNKAPLAGVSVTVANLTEETNATGEARFDDLAPGEHVVFARKTAHRTAQLAATVLAGQVTTVEIVLAAEAGGQHAHEKGTTAHRDLYEFQGHFDCSATYLIITGDCLLVVDAAAAAAGVPANGSATSERYLLDFPLDAGWTTLVVEMTWNASTGPSDGMTLALEPAEAPADGHAAKYARTDGSSASLALRLEAGETHETATAEDKPNPDGGEVIRARAFVRGLEHRPGGTEYLGVGASVQHEFTLFVSIFYGEKPDAGYTALGGA